MVKLRARDMNKGKRHEQCTVKMTVIMLQLL